MRIRLPTALLAYGLERPSASSTVDIHGRPLFARHSFDDDKQVKIACIHPVFSAVVPADPDGIRWPVPQ